MSGTIVALFFGSSVRTYVSSPSFVASKISQPSFVYERPGSRWSGLSGMPASRTPPLTGVVSSPREEDFDTPEVTPIDAARASAASEASRGACGDAVS